MYDVATAQNNEEDEEEINKEYESQPIISLKAALESVDNLMRFVNDPPSGFDKKALSVLRLLKSEIWWAIRIDKIISYHSLYEFQYF